MTLKQWGDLPDDVYAELVNGVLVEDEMTTEIHDALMTFLLGFFFTPRDIRRDRVEKRRDYARFGVRWYWIVDPTLHTVEILGLAKSGRYEHVADASRGKLRVPGCRGRVLDVDALWREAERTSPPRRGRVS